MDLNAMKEAARAAIKSSRTTSAMETDEDLHLYKMLKPSDIPALMEKYGPENVITYVREMEARLQKKGV